MSWFQIHLLRDHVLVVDPFVLGLDLSIVTYSPLMNAFINMRRHEFLGGEK
jgi:hypothetical protein